jgi:nucleotide-binding universal stress UspA family protein
MKQIIVGVDGSKASHAAAQKGAEFAAATKAVLRLVCVVPPIEAFTNVVASPRDIKEARAAANSILDEVAQDVRGVEVVKEIGDGSPAEVLATLAAQPEVDMVVIGHRGRGMLSRLLIGSVADRLVQISPKPVLVVR